MYDQNQPFEQSGNIKQDDPELEDEPYLKRKICWLFLLERNNQANSK